jgi:uncharacterized protein YggT (Ycf19 family)
MSGEDDELFGKPAPPPQRNFDLFSVPTAASSSEPYVSSVYVMKKNQDARFAVGKKTVTIGPPHKGNGNDATFSPFISLAGSDQDKYKGKPRVSKTPPPLLIPFRRSSPPKKPFDFYISCFFFCFFFIFLLIDLGLVQYMDVSVTHHTIR